MGPQYETIYAFGGLCMVKSIEEIIYLMICVTVLNRHDHGSKLGRFCDEASKKGKIKEKLEYGDVDGIAQMLINIGSGRKGDGRILSRGSPRRSVLGDGRGKPST